MTATTQSHASSGSNVQALKVHVSLNVRDLGKSLEFYRRMLGIEPSKVRPGYAKFDVRNPPVNLALNEVADVAANGTLSHLGIQVSSTADVLATRERWADEGLVTRDEMKTDCCYATQDKTWVHDPDGNEWEVFVVLEDNLPAATSGSCCVKPAAKAEEPCCDPVTAQRGDACCSAAAV